MQEAAEAARDAAEAAREAAEAMRESAEAMGEAAQALKRTADATELSDRSSFDRVSCPGSEETGRCGSDGSSMSSAKRRRCSSAAQ